MAEGDSTAFDTLYHATSAKLFGIVLRILKSRELAEDALQDVYMKIWERAGSYDASKSAPMTWMATVARNQALDLLRHRASRPQEIDIDVENHIDTDHDAIMRLELMEDYDKLLGCLERLDPRRREIVVLAYRDGYSREELSKQYNAPQGTIKTWLRRSLAQLRDCLSS